MSSTKKMKWRGGGRCGRARGMASGPGLTGGCGAGRSGVGRVLGEVRDLLRLTVVHHLEVGALQSSNGRALPIRDNDVEARQAHFQRVEKRRRHASRRNIDRGKQYQGRKNEDQSLPVRPPVGRDRWAVAWTC